MHFMTGLSSRTEMAAGNRRTSNRVSARFTPKTPHLLSVLVEAGDGRPLHPCHPARARQLIQKKRAVRICRRPYAIRLIVQHQPFPQSALSQEDSQ